MPLPVRPHRPPSDTSAAGVIALPQEPQTAVHVADAGGSIRRELPGAAGEEGSEDERTSGSDPGEEDPVGLWVKTKDKGDGGSVKDCIHNSGVTTSYRLTVWDCFTS